MAFPRANLEASLLEFWRSDCYNRPIFAVASPLPGGQRPHVNLDNGVSSGSATHASAWRGVNEEEGGGGGASQRKRLTVPVSEMAIAGRDETPRSGLDRLAMEEYMQEEVPWSPGTPYSGPGDHGEGLRLPEQASEIESGSDELVEKHTEDASERNLQENQPVAITAITVKTRGATAREESNRNEHAKPPNFVQQNVRRASMTRQPRSPRELTRTLVTPSQLVIPPARRVEDEETQAEEERPESSPSRPSSPPQRSSSPQRKRSPSAIVSNVGSSVGDDPKKQGTSQTEEVVSVCLSVQSASSLDHFSRFPCMFLPSR